ACAQCHTHKYDPISQQEYFRFFALLNNTEDSDKKDETPVLKFFTKKDKEQRGQWETELAPLQQKLKTPTPELLAAETKWERAFPLDLQWMPLKPGVLKSKNDSVMSSLEDGIVLVTPGKKTDTYTLDLPLASKRITGLRLEALPHESLPKHGPG